MTEFNAFTAKLTNCPACLAAALPGLGQAIADGVDAALGDTYCASPGGATDQRRPEKDELCLPISHEYEGR